MGNRLRSALLVGAVLGAVGGFAPAALAAGAQDGTEVSRERGHVLDCRGAYAGGTVTVNLYDNSIFGNFVSVGVEGPGSEGTRYVGDAQPSSLFRGSTVSAQVKLRKATGGGGPAGSAVIVGGFRAKGKPTPVHEVIEDAGYRVESTGSHQPLAVKAGVVLRGSYVALTCQEAFRYDLKVEKTPI